MKQVHISLRAVGKTYKGVSEELEVLKGISLEIPPAMKLCIVGRSGSGKSTLLHMLGTLDNPDRGHITYNGEEFHRLLPDFTALENVMMPGIIRGDNRTELENRAAEILDYLELSPAQCTINRANCPGGSSNGQRLRGAVICSPAVILADEPTGNLDSISAASVFQLLCRLSSEKKCTLVLVTHNRELMKGMDECYELNKNNCRLNPGQVYAQEETDGAVIHRNRLLIILMPRLKSLKSLPVLRMTHLLIRKGKRIPSNKVQLKGAYLRVSDDIRSLYNLGYFDDVRVYADDTDRRKISLTFEFKEKPQILNIRFQSKDSYTADTFRLITMLTKIRETRFPAEKRIILRMCPVILAGEPVSPLPESRMRSAILGHMSVSKLEEVMTLKQYNMLDYAKLANDMEIIREEYKKAGVLPDSEGDRYYTGEIKVSSGDNNPREKLPGRLFFLAGIPLKGGTLANFVLSFLDKGVIKTGGGVRTNLQQENETGFTP
ncbi:hypothetical protein CHS0354_018440 [Potamilus streckersoni]|uniref:ABC transporter domain-containing protein n=1 Tax=Potamilus streckersoni TaxID=2493646 RepID=A0AAE0TAM5_9BIVA|nr:hypothetical protein CHS0354_018440 [Potamilus streckersoni]